MRIWKIVGVVFAVLFVICVVGGLLLPNAWHVETAVVIDASPERIHREIATPRNFVRHAEAHARLSSKAPPCLALREMGSLTRARV